MFGDSHGNVVHLFERDCSLQRRHQKVIEEAPAPGHGRGDARGGLRRRGARGARRSTTTAPARSSSSPTRREGLRADRIWFMEMNTRLQVEHPVTEEITGAGSGRMAAARRVGRAAAEAAGRAGDQRLGDGSAALCRGSGEGLPAERRQARAFRSRRRRPHRNRRRGGRRDLALLRSDDRQADRAAATTATRRSTSLPTILDGRRSLAGPDQCRLPVQCAARPRFRSGEDRHRLHRDDTSTSWSPTAETDDAAIRRAAAAVAILAARIEAPLARPRRASGSMRRRGWRSRSADRLVELTTTTRLPTSPASPMKSAWSFSAKGQAYEFGLALRAARGTCARRPRRRDRGADAGQGDGGRGFAGRKGCQGATLAHPRSDEDGACADRAVRRHRRRAQPPRPAPR